jgi:MYXO-CTERM domain-containing protein
VTSNPNAADLIGVAFSGANTYVMDAKGDVFASSDGQIFRAVVVNLPHAGTFTCLVSDAAGDLLAATDQGQVLLAPPPALMTPSFADVNTALPRGNDVVSVSFGSALVGLVVQGNQLLLTEDGGHTFVVVGPTIPTGDPTPLWQAVYMPTASDAFAVGSAGVFAVSHDAGKTWSFLFPPGVTENLLAVFFADVNNGYAVGTGGVVVSTRNGGATFTVMHPTSITLNTLAFFDPYHGIVAGQYGFVLTTVDGSTWAYASGVSGIGSVLGAAVVSPSSVYIVGQNGLFAASHDEGQSFTTLVSPASSDLTAIWFRDRQNGYILTNDATNASGAVLVTHDGAQTFTTQFSASPLLGLSFGDSLDGYAVGAGGTLLATTTAGEPPCQSAADCPVDPKGILGYTCMSGACVPCTSDDSCTAACTACVAPDRYCYTGYCGNCLTSGGCISPAQCVLGVCQMAPPFDGGVDAGPLPDAGRDAGTPDSGVRDAGAGDGGNGDGGAIGDGGTGGGCGCSSTTPGTALEVALLALVVLAFFSPRRRREG